MKRLRTTSMIAALCSFGLALATVAVHAADDNKLSIPVAFGRGLNIAANLPENQIMIPDTVRLKQNGVVHFLVAGFHEIAIYNPGKTTDDGEVRAGETFINDATNRFYKGIVPAGGPPPALPVTTDPSNGGDCRILAFATAVRHVDTLFWHKHSSFDCFSPHFFSIISRSSKSACRSSSCSTSS